MKYSHTPTSLFFLLLYTDRAIYHCHICTEGLCIWTSFCQVKQKKKRGTEKRRSLRPHPRGRSDRLSVTRACQQWRLRRSIAGCRVTVRLVPIQFVKFKHIWLSELWLVLLFYWNIGKRGKIRDCKEVFTDFTTYKKTYFMTSATPETKKIKNFEYHHLH